MLGGSDERGGKQMTRTWRRRILSAALMAAGIILLYAAGAEGKKDYSVQYYQAYAFDNSGDIYIDITVNYPQIEGLPKKVESVVNEAIYDCAMFYVNDCYLEPTAYFLDSMKEKENFYIFSILVNSHISYYNGTLINIMFEEEQTMGGLYSSGASLRSMTVNLKTGEIYALSDLVEPSEEFTELWISKLEAANEMYYADLVRDILEHFLLQETIGKDVFEISANYYIDDQGQVIGGVGGKDEIIIENERAFTDEEWKEFCLDPSFVLELGKENLPIAQYTCPNRRDRNINKDIQSTKEKMAERVFGVEGSMEEELPAEDDIQDHLECTDLCVTDITIENPWKQTLEEMQALAEQEEREEQERQKENGEQTDIIWETENACQGDIFQITTELPTESAQYTAISGNISHVVQKGDSLWKLAEAYCGDGEKYTELLQENQEETENPNFLRVGQTINIPQEGYLYISDYLIDSVSLEQHFRIRTPFDDRAAVCIYDNDYYIVGTETGCVAVNQRERNGERNMPQESWEELKWEIKDYIGRMYTAFPIHHLQFEEYTIENGDKIYGFTYQIEKEEGRLGIVAVYYRYTQGYLAEFIGYTEYPEDNDIVSIARVMAFAFADDTTPENRKDGLLEVEPDYRQHIYLSSQFN